MLDTNAAPDVPGRPGSGMTALNGAISAHDAETGLYSRHGLTEKVRQLLEAGRHDVIACLVVRLFVDAGDTPRILHRAVAALTATTRLGDVVARLAHTDFAVIAPDTDAAGARRLAERVSAAVRDMFTRTGRRERVRLLVGYDLVADIGARAVAAETLLVRATAAARSAMPDAQGRSSRGDRQAAQLTETLADGPLVETAVCSHGSATAEWTPLGPRMRAQT